MASESISVHPWIVRVTNYHNFCIVLSHRCKVRPAACLLQGTLKFDCMTVKYPQYTRTLQSLQWVSRRGGSWQIGLQVRGHFQTINYFYKKLVIMKLSLGPPLLGRYTCRTLKRMVSSEVHAKISVMALTPSPAPQRHNDVNFSLEMSLYCRALVFEFGLIIGLASCVLAM